MSNLVSLSIAREDMEAYFDFYTSSVLECYNLCKDFNIYAYLNNNYYILIGTPEDMHEFLKISYCEYDDDFVHAMESQFKPV